MSTQRLEQVARATFDANGRATITFPTVPAWHRWTVTRTSVTTTSTALTSCNTYKGDPAAANILDSAPYSGNGDSSDTSIVLEAGEWLSVRWENGTPGATATATIGGTDEG